MNQTTQEQPAATLDPKGAHLLHQWQFTSPLIACRFAPSGQHVFTTAEDCSIQRWEITTGKPTVLTGHESWVNDLAFLQGGKTLVSVGCDDSLIFWEAEAAEPKPVKTVKAHLGWIRTVSVSPDEKLIATAGNDRTVRLWDADGNKVREFAGHESDVYSSLFHPGGQFLLTGDLLGQIKQWEVATGNLVRTFDAKELHSYNDGQQVHYGGVRGLCLSADQKQLYGCGLHQASNPLGAVNDPLVLQFDWETGNKTRSHVAGDIKGIGWKVACLGDGSVICASGGSGGGFLLFWKPAEDKIFHQFNLPNTARDMGLHPNGLQVVTAHHDRHVRISELTPPPPPKPA